MPAGSGQTNALRGVACTASNSCWSVGTVATPSTGSTLGLTEHWNGTSWSRAASPNSGSQPAALSAIACADASHCWAVGWHSAVNQIGGSHSYALQWNGSSWTSARIPDAAGVPYDYLRGIACVSAAYCWAVGIDDVNNSGGPNDRTLVESWNGSSWSLATSPNASQSSSDDLNAVTCLSAAMCWAVGSVSFSQSQPPLIERWDGSSWSIVAPSTSNTSMNGTLASVACVSASDCWAVGMGSYRTLTEHWDGVAWTVVSSPDTGSQDDDYLTGVKCLAAADCWAVGYAHDSSNSSVLDRVITTHWDGSSWSMVSSPDTAYNDYLMSIDCTSSAECWAVGWSSDSSGPTRHTLAEHWDGWSWNLAASADMAGAEVSYVYGPEEGSWLASVACVSASDCRGAGSAMGDDDIPLTLVERDATANAPAPLGVVTTSLPSGSVGTSYSAALAATGGTHPYSWAVIAGQLPNGLALAGSTGIISGTPVTTGTFTFTVQVTDSGGRTASRALSISIAA